MSTEYDLKQELGTTVDLELENFKQRLSAWLDRWGDRSIEARFHGLFKDHASADFHCFDEPEVELCDDLNGEALPPLPLRPLVEAWLGSLYPSNNAECCTEWVENAAKGFDELAGQCREWVRILRESQERLQAQEKS